MQGCHFMKEDERAKKIKAKKQKAVEEVKIQIGVMEEANGRLKKVKGRTLPLMVPANITAGELLKAATAKHGRHFKQFNPQESYFLLYPDQTVVSTLPGSSEPFVLNQYKEELGKPFSKLYFWLCSTSDMENLTGDSDSDSSEPGPSFLTVEGVEERGVSQKPNYGTSNSEVEAKACYPAGGHGTCPTCYRVFPLEEIEKHADLCADSCIDTVGELDSYREDVELEEPYRVELASEGSEHEGDMSQNLKEDLKTLQQNVDSSKKTRISVRRKSMFQDYIEARKKKWFNSRQTLKVTFIGEPAIDDGGPLQEFFTEVLKHIQYHLFPDGMPINSMTALAKNEFTVAGELMAASVVQGGPAPCFLSKEAFGYIVDGIDSVSTEDWIPRVRNQRLKGAIEWVRSCSTDEELRQVLMKDSIPDILSFVGYRGVPRKETLSSKEAILR
ncbi:G2/M phase-specific E3 ubiquitin-protein ligase-like [Acropora millepora]|uniref:G2/M phase-specific E3 ubiquitin-protein ligase-like n=1 Tax=Acropora millepora TaxID=45264 RepID=UPI001CF40F09|nr:G2/M phase-specific E3 ubiquitin-protein ligase-like [Acropora millepora]